MLAKGAREQGLGIRNPNISYIIESNNYYHGDKKSGRVRDYIGKKFHWFASLMQSHAGLGVSRALQ